MDIAAAEHPQERYDDNFLAEKMAEFYGDPLGFVYFVFPWGQPGTRLADEEGPDEWQTKLLTRLGEEIRNGFPDNEAIQMAVASGHGIGKTAMTSWIILWFISTRPNPQIVVTANTRNQLTTKTWRELAKWKEMAIHGHWFDYTATQIKMRSDPETWFGTAVPWNAAHAGAFAGTHEEHVLMLFDEASEIDDIIWETAEGAMTTPGAMWLCFGNPTKNTGRFRECWTKFAKRWITMRVDSRTAKMADRRQLDKWIEDYGEDSDFVRVRVLGRFPAAGPKQLIPSDVAEAAQMRDIKDETIPGALPKLMGVDIGSYGDAETVICMRKGPKLKPEMPHFREADPVKIAGYIGQYINEWEPDVIFIDAVGYGHGVYLLLLQRGYNIIPAYAGERKEVIDKRVFYNPRIEWWYRMREWLAHADIPAEKQLFADLIGPEYAYDNSNLMRLESKDDMRKRGIASPDFADALALTFAQVSPVKQNLSWAGESDMYEPEVE